MTWASIQFALWRYESEGNLARTNSGEFAAVQSFRRVMVHVEVSTTNPLIKCAPRGGLMFPLEQLADFASL